MQIDEAVYNSQSVVGDFFVDPGKSLKFALESFQSSYPEILRYFKRLLIKIMRLLLIKINYIDSKWLKPVSEVS